MIGVFLISLVLYFRISKSPRIEDLFISFAATVLGIIVTLLLVERSIKRQENEEWEEFEKIISNQIIDILFTLCNYSNISSILWEQYLEIFKKDVDTKDKIIKYINYFHSSEINLDYIKKIVSDEHLIEFFSRGYKSIFQNLDDTFRLYGNKLSSDQSTNIINLKMKVSILINNMNRFYTANFAIKEFNVPLETALLNDFKENVNKAILAANKLLQTI
ncbi:MAG: hypothetical protein A2V93_08860 [Ignavibacteria bacterium RBG_16_34_14]|nr:MAG: hypothetical protein A2V93_08860 [Ignavibacteria bacterium RBG_16_34_14]